MTETGPTEEHHRHEVEPEAASRPWLPWVIGIGAVIVVLLVIVIVLLLIPRGTPAPTPTTPSPSASTPSPTPSQTSAPPTSTACTTRNSSVALGTPDGTAGSTMVPIVFTNTGTANCTREGFPVVEFVGGGNGTKIGPAAANDTTTSPVQLITIAPGNSAASLLRVMDAGNVCDSPVNVDGFRVIPPGSNDAFFVADTNYQACDSSTDQLLTVSAVDTN